MLDRIPLPSLISRYGLGRTALHERIKALNLKPHKEANRAFFDADQVALLDALNAHIQGGGNTPEFVRSIQPEQSEQSEQFTLQSFTPNNPNIHPEQSERWLYLLEFFADRLLLTPPPSPPDPLRLHRQLEEIASQGWIVTTAQLKSILDCAPHPGDRYGFRFTKVGRQGAQMGWQVCKISAALP